MALLHGGSEPLFTEIVVVIVVVVVVVVGRVRFDAD